MFTFVYQKKEFYLFISFVPSTCLQSGIYKKKSLHAIMLFIKIPIKWGMHKGTKYKLAKGKIEDDMCITGAISSILYPS